MSDPVSDPNSFKDEQLLNEDPFATTAEDALSQPALLYWNASAGLAFVLVNALLLATCGKLIKLPRLEYPGIGLLFGILVGQAICLTLWSRCGRCNTACLATLNEVSMRPEALAQIEIHNSVNSVLIEAARKARATT